MAIDDVTIRREVILSVDRATAWALLVDPQELATWLADEVHLEIEVGAEGWLRSEDGELRHARVEEVAQQRRLVLRWSGSGGPETVVEFTLDDLPEGTRLVVLELPVVQLEALAAELEPAPPVIRSPGLGSSQGPQMVAALA